MPENWGWDIAEVVAVTTLGRGEVPRDTLQENKQRQERDLEIKGHPGWTHEEIHPKFLANLFFIHGALFNRDLQFEFQTKT